QAGPTHRYAHGDLLRGAGPVVQRSPRAECPFQPRLLSFFVVVGACASIIPLEKVKNLLRDVNNRSSMSHTAFHYNSVAVQLGVQTDFILESILEVLPQLGLAQLYSGAVLLRHLLQLFASVLELFRSTRPGQLIGTGIKI